MEKSERDGYWIIQWSDGWDPSLADILQSVPELVCGKRIAITSCDSGPYVPTSDEITMGWRFTGVTAISIEITQPAELPMPGFDEWYVFDSAPQNLPTCNYVNRFGFSVLDESDGTTSFWEQIAKTQPLHALGAGAPNMFFLTRDLKAFELVLQAEPFAVLR
jgi:hypothetical protein